MYFITVQTKEQRELYFSYLRAVCSLSRLFSDSEVPFLYYRASENVFCKSFIAENLSRDDLAYDAKKQDVGIGLKTFISSGSASEKISEFNAFSNKLKRLKGNVLATKLAELRNERINFANRTYGIEKGIYHCVARSDGLLQVFETNYDSIEIDHIRNIRTSKAGIQFEDGRNEYSFNFSKSTLFKRFYTPKDAIELDIEILDDPFEAILQVLKREAFERPTSEIPGVDYVILPLYSLKESKQGSKVVASKSSLNQWNAGGRARDVGEVYIPIPILIHKNYPNFFPSREKPFTLHIPSGETLSAKVCQENSKALMTNPNNALSDWLLRKVLKLKEGELLTYQKLKILGIDSVRITKVDEGNFTINFARLDSYDIFESLIRH